MAEEKYVPRLKTKYNNEVKQLMHNFPRAALRNTQHRHFRVVFLAEFRKTVGVHDLYA